LRRPDPDFGRGVWYGAATGIGLGVAAAVIVVSIIGSKADMPGYAWSMLVLPGALLLGLIMGLPVAAATVWLAIKLQRRSTVFAHPLGWGLLGALFTTPAAWFVSLGMDSLPVFAFVCLIGSVSAACAWYGAHRKG
jgi:hypothetical protein